MEQAAPATPTPTVESQILAANIDLSISFRGGAAEGKAFMRALEGVLKQYGKLLLSWWGWCWWYGFYTH